MSLWEVLTNWISKDSHELVYASIDPSRVDKPQTAVPVEAEKHYYRLTLAQMVLRKKSKVFQEWYPAVHSFVQCSFGGKTIELPNVADSSHLLAKQDGQGDVIARNFTLVPLMPFKGGEIRMIAGLFAVPGENHLNQFMGVMSDFAKLLAVPQLSTALTVAEPLAKGIQTLFGIKGGMHLGFHDTFVGAGGTNELISRYIALVRTKAGEFTSSELCVVNNELRIGNGIADGQHRPFEGKDFMLLNIEVLEERDDWNQLTNIATPVQEAITALKDLDENKADIKLREALVAALNAPELTKVDRRRVVTLIKEDYKNAKADLGFHGLLGEGGEYNLQMRIRSAGMTTKRAIELGEPSYADLTDI